MAAFFVLKLLKTKRIHELLVLHIGLESYRYRFKINLDKENKEHKYLDILET